jgi:hypothetical protein
MTARAPAPLRIPHPLTLCELDLVLLEVTKYLRAAVATYGSTLTAAEVQLVARDLRHLLVVLDQRGLAERYGREWGW